MPLLSKLPSCEGEEVVIKEHHGSMQSQQRELSEKTGRGTGLDKEEEDSEYEYPQDCLDSDMEGSVLNRPRPKKRKENGRARTRPPPALPMRSEKRASMILQSMMLEMKSLDGTANKELEKQGLVAEEDPHELYLSSEEDASLIDEYDDSDSISDLGMADSNNTGKTTVSRASSRKSQEDIATVVSFMVVGKPQIVVISINSSQASPKNQHALDPEALATTLNKSSAGSKSLRPSLRRPPPLKLFHSPLRRSSISSIASTATVSTVYTTASHTSSERPPTHNFPPPRSTSYIMPSKMPNNSSSTSLRLPKPSRLLNLTTMISSRKSSLTSSSALPLNTPSSAHAFLNMDPFEAAHYKSPITPSPTTTQTSRANSTAGIEIGDEEPKTPGAISSAWKMGKGFGRSLSKARKASMPKLSLAYNNSKSNLLLSATEFATNLDEKLQKAPRMGVNRSTTMPVQPTSPGESPVLYHDIMRNSIKGPPLISPTSLKEKKGGILGIGIGGSKSLKVR